MEQSANPPASTPVERLREYLRLLPPNSRSLLMREYEAALERGDDVAVAHFVLTELRSVARAQSTNDRPRTQDICRIVFTCLDPFFVDTKDIRPGQVRRSSIEPVWTWLKDAALPQETETLRLKIESDPSNSESYIRDWHLAASAVILTALAPLGPRDGVRSAMPLVADDLESIGRVFAEAEALGSFRDRLPKMIRGFTSSEVSSIKATLSQFPSIQKPGIAAFTAASIMQRLMAPWHIVRLLIGLCGSDEEGRISALPHSVAVSMVLHDLAAIASELRNDVKRSQFESGARALKTLHDGLRDLRSELDLRSDSQWSRQLAAVRVDVSNALKVEIDSLPGRVRRLLRQRTDKDIDAGAKLDSVEVDETVALISFLMICRTYAGELAINEVTLRTASDLQHYVETATEALVESLRAADGRIKAFRQTQTDIAIRFCEALFGSDYAALMTKAAEVAASGERKAANGR